MMPPPRRRRFRSILCAVDFSSSSAKAVRYAAALARACGGRVTAIYAADPLLAAAAAAAYDSQVLERSALADLEKFVRRSVPDPAAAAGIRSVVRVGAPGPVILAFARRTRAGIVVMGTHGRRGAAKLLFGSTTEAVLRRFCGPVLAIPPRCGGPRPGWPNGSIVAAVDAGAHHRASLSVAARVAERFAAWLSLAPPAAAARHGGARMIILPLPPAARLGMLRQGSAAYRFVCGARRPVLVVRARTRGRPGIRRARAA